MKKINYRKKMKKNVFLVNECNHTLHMFKIITKKKKQRKLQKKELFEIIILVISFFHFKNNLFKYILQLSRGNEKRDNEILYKNVKIQINEREFTVCRKREEE